MFRGLKIPLTHFTPHHCHLFLYTFSYIDLGANTIDAHIRWVWCYRHPTQATQSTTRTPTTHILSASHHHNTLNTNHEIPFSLNKPQPNAHCPLGSLWLECPNHWWHRIIIVLHGSPFQCLVEQKHLYSLYLYISANVVPPADSNAVQGL